jgi:hypothetical protein
MIARHRRAERVGPVSCQVNAVLGKVRHHHRGTMTAVRDQEVPGLGLPGTVGHRTKVVRWDRRTLARALFQG